MNTQLAVQQAAPTGAWGSEGVSSKDLIVPRISLQHDISDLVKKGKAQPGDLVSSLTGEILGNGQTALEVIGVKTFREYIINEVDRGKVKFLRKELITAANEDAPAEDIVDGKAIERIKTLNFFFVLPKALQSLPHLCTFKKSSYYPGRQIATHFKMCELQGNTPAAQVFKLGATTKTYNGFTFWALTVEPARAATQPELDQAYFWWKTLNSSSVKVDDGEASDDLPNF